MKFNYLALLQGGIGPDAWDKEFQISAVDFMDAAKQAQARAEEYNGYVASLEGDPEPFKEPESDGSSHSLLLKQIREVQLRTALLEFVRVERMFGHNGQHSESECADCKRMNAANTALGHGFLKELEPQP